MYENTFRFPCRSWEYELSIVKIDIARIRARICFMGFFQTGVQRSAVCGVAVESRWRVFLHSWCDTELCGNYFILALAKTVTPAGAPGGSRGGLCRCTLNVPFWLESSRGTEGNAIYRLVRYFSGFLIWVETEEISLEYSWTGFLVYSPSRYTSLEAEECSWVGVIRDSY